MVINPILADLNLADAHPDDNWEYPGSVTWGLNATFAGLRLLLLA
jgi:hypothetical protein